MKSLISNIVIAVTGSDASLMAAKHAIIMAKTYQCYLTAVYVVDTATIKQLTLGKIFVKSEGAEFEKSLELNGKRYLSFIEELANAKGLKIEKVLCKGAVYTEVLAIADECKADLIILGGWEKDRSALDIIGHAHREIMINAKCSVMLVKEPGIDQIYKEPK
jgi:nucleotide-binding universal stress UspA family protein